MKNTALLTWTLLSLVMLVSCDINSNLQSTTAAPTPSKLNPTLTATMTEQPMLSIMNTAHENIVMTTSSGEYLVYDIDDSDTSMAELPADCLVISDGRRAICQAIRGLITIDLASGQQTNIPLAAEPDGWELTSGEGTLYYQMRNGKISDLYRYDFESGINTPLGTINNSDWEFYPKLSDQDSYLVGLQRNEETGYLAMPYKLAPGGDSERIEHEIKWSVSDLSWSPSGELLGIGAVDEIFSQTDMPQYCLTTVFLTYQIDTKDVRQVAHAPADTCYVYFYLTSRNIWSPDNRYVVVVVSEPFGQSDQELCIIDIVAGNQRCLAKEQPSELIWLSAWSPDSQRLAYLVYTDGVRQYDLHVVSVDGSSETTLLKNIVVDSDFSDLVWTRANP